MKLQFTTRAKNVVTELGYEYIEATREGKTVTATAKDGDTMHRVSMTMTPDFTVVTRDEHFQLVEEHIDTTEPNKVIFQ